MKNLTRILITICVGGIASTSQAADSLHNFKHSTLDATGISSAPKDLTLQRIYQSRSLFRGFFGHGWCSNLDRSLNTKQIDMVKYNDCSFDSAFRFRLTEAGKGYSLYESLDNPELSLKKTNNYLQLTTPRRILVFSTQGRLSKVSSPSENYELNYNSSGELTFIQTRNAKYKVKLNQAGRIVSIKTSEKQQKLTYTYQGVNLVRVSGKASTKHYSYSDLHNLTQIKEKGFTRNMHYNELTDSLVAIGESDGCKQNRDHSSLGTQVTLNCGYGSTHIEYDHSGRLVSFYKQGLGKAKIQYNLQSQIQAIIYTDKRNQERRYTLNQIPAQARGDTELDTLLILASEATQAI